MAKIRDPDLDKLKSESVMREQHTKKVTCVIEGCSELITPYNGPDSDSKCRTHQMQNYKYGGNAYPDREYTYNKKDRCECCNWSPFEDERYNNVEDYEDEADMNRCLNKMLDIDHLDGDHSNNTKENCRTTCKPCHTKKTHINKDNAYR